LLTITQVLDSQGSATEQFRCGGVAANSTLRWNVGV